MVFYKVEGYEAQIRDCDEAIKELELEPKFEEILESQVKNQQLMRFVEIRAKIQQVELDNQTVLNNIQSCQV